MERDHLESRESDSTDSADGSGRSFPDWVRAVLPSLPDEFTLHDVLNALAKARGPRPSDYTGTARLLKRLTERGELECIEPGAGKRPSRYTVPKKVGVDLNEIFDISLKS